jgi:hypothetical protein
MSSTCPRRRWCTPRSDGARKLRAEGGLAHYKSGSVGATTDPKAKGPRQRIAEGAYLAWVVAVAVVGAVLLRQGVRRWVPEEPSNSWHLSSPLFALLLAMTVLGFPLCARLFRTRLALPSMLAMTATSLIALAWRAHALADVALLLTMHIGFYEIGGQSLRVLGFPKLRAAERLVVHIALGQVVYVLWLLVAGSLNALRYAVIIAPLMAFCGIWAVRLLRKRTVVMEWLLARRDVSWFETILLGLTVLYLLVGYTIALGPEVMGDSVREHLPIAREFAEQHSTNLLANLRRSSWPSHSQLLFAAGLVMHGECLARLVHTAAGAMAVVGLGVAAHEYGGRKAGLVAAALVAAFPPTLWEMGIAYVDLFPPMYLSVAVLCLLRWYKEGGWRWMALVGVMCGVAVAAKLTAGFPSASFGLTVLLVGRARAPVWGRFLAALGIVAGAVVPLGPWLLRSLLLAGEIPGLTLLVDAIKPLWVGAGGGSATPADHFFVSSLGDLPGYGLGSGFVAFLLLPWHLTMQTSSFGEWTDGFLGFALLLLLPLLLALPPRRTTFALLVLFGAPLLCWFVTAQYVRYLLPSLWGLALLLGAGFSRLGDHVARPLPPRGGSVWVTPFSHTGTDQWPLQRFAKHGLQLALAGALACSMVFLLVQMRSWPGGLPMRILSGDETADDYLRRRVPCYPAVQWLNSRTPPNTSIVAVPDTYSFYLRATALTPSSGGFVFSESPTDLEDQLQRNGIEYVLVNRAHLPDMRADWYERSYPVLADFLNRNARITFAENGVYVYQLRADSPSHGSPSGFGPELLVNPDFELGESGPEGWSVIGNPGYDNTGHHSGHGLAAVRVAPDDAYFQAVPVTPGRSYALGFSVLCTTGGGHVAVRWLDRAKNPVATSFDPLLLRGDVYARQDMRFWAPPEAAYAEIRACPVDVSDTTTCWLDDYSFRPAE